MLEAILQYRTAVTFVLGTFTVCCIVVGYLGGLYDSQAFIPRTHRRSFRKQVREVFSKGLITRFNVLILVLILLIGGFLFLGEPKSRGDIVLGIGGGVIVVASCIGYILDLEPGEILHKKPGFIALMISVGVYAVTLVYYAVFKGAWKALLAADVVLIAVFTIALIYRKPWFANRNVWDKIGRAGLISLALMILWAIAQFLV